MKRFIRDMFGGLVIIVAAGVVGILVNTVRGDSVPLIQDIKAVSTAVHATGGTGGDSAGGDESITVDQVMDLMRFGDAFVIDARPVSDFESGHIPGALNVPYDRLPEYMDALTAMVPLDAQIVCYCTGPNCDFSDQLATEMKFMGYTNILVFTGGWEHWEAAGYEIEKGSTDQ